MIIKTYIAKNTEFAIDTEKLEMDKKGKIVGVPNWKFSKRQLANADIVEFFVRSYSLVKIGNFYYAKDDVAGMLRGASIQV
ncbi:hypothetical protein [Fibrobacter succinogenes]|jgi:hypothetical protein|uniref:hypothetical protein n=1 Tax=Fibrobacter succinogenes TaxID=833 RepID=UPI001568470B|nr:hypothetical protein [Fibrobacter succinogenes]